MFSFCDKNKKCVAHMETRTKNARLQCCYAHEFHFPIGAHEIGECIFTIGNMRSEGKNMQFMYVAIVEYHILGKNTRV